MAQRKGPQLAFPRSTSATVWDSISEYSFQRPSREGLFAPEFRGRMEAISLKPLHRYNLRQEWSEMNFEYRCTALCVAARKLTEKAPLAQRVAMWRETPRYRRE